MEINNDPISNIDNKPTLLNIIKEEVIIDKQLIETNKIRLTKHVEEESQLVDLPLIHEEIIIETIPINEYVDVAPEAIRYEGDTTIISVLKEVVVVRILLEKEIRITKKTIETQHSETIILKKENVIIENIAPINK